MATRLLLVSTLITLACNLLHAAGRNSDPAPGIARDLALFRAAHYSNVRYELQVEIEPGAPVMKGAMKISVALDDQVNQLVLDWRTIAAKQNEPQTRLWDIEVNGRRAVDARQVNDHIVIPSSYLVKGENVVSLRFESFVAASGSAVTRYLDREDNSEYVYTLFVPSDASTAFPCFDQPDLKARFTLDITAPATWKVITNTDVDVSDVSIFDLNTRQATSPRAGTKRVRFRETEPISTYLFAFAAGEFTEFRDQTSRIPMRLFVRKSKAARAQKELAEVFRFNREALKFFAHYFDFKFPFPKYDLVVLPEFPYGGMEHAGATFLREDSILFPVDPTANDLLSRAELIFHEAAHQWFGDLVTMRWFDDLWLKEGFATFMAYKAIDHLMPQHNAWKAFYQRTKPAAYVTDVTKGTTPIWQEIPNLSAAKSAYGNIVYRKAPSMLKQAEFFLEPDKFQRAVRLLLKEHAYANAEWADLVRAFGRTTNRPLDRWAAAWVKRRGMPDVRAEWDASPGGRINQFTLRQTDVLGEGGAWPMRVKVLLWYETAPPETLIVMMNGAGATHVREAIGKPRPSFVFANYDDYGYGRFLLDEKSRSTVTAKLDAVREEFLRALLWGSLWDSVREAELAPSDYINLGIKHLAAEQDEVTVQSILGRVLTAFNRYLTQPQREAVAPLLERMIYERMTHAETTGLRITYFRAFQAVAVTNEARANLKQLLGDELEVPGMRLRPRDRFDIITWLFARRDGDAPALFERQRSADTTDDGRRYAFAAGAARASRENKKNYYDAYLSDPKLAESWIEASLNGFNAIDQADLTLPFLEGALAQLPTLKRTRKIFFVNAWLAAFLGGQCNERARAVVQNFLAREQSLDRDLRLKVLEAADSLERCVKIKSRYGRTAETARAPE